ncbi:hypothetical protein HELRODRAFT_178615 [Helobdella robusta]|uniref:Uncharacterized protein n=1 Tax=Helobdella robusta TaxID=6412 RepID=T1FDG4_HELRO|nr:hypothetical protein HELRODRAFT_178615 [Helobdella robusta]ESN96820.1 hypothetical protein HELRODRAFT_178615 [Helobdella robusta]
MAPTLQQCLVCFNHYRSTPDGKLCRHGGKVKGQECSGSRKKVDPSGARAASPLDATPDPKPRLSTRSTAASVSGDPLDLDYSSVLDKLTAVLKCVPVYDHIPKPCREKFAHDLNALLTAVCNDPGDPAHWVRLHCFVPYVLQKTSRGGRRVNQGNLVNKRLSEYSTIGLETLVLCFDGFNNAKSQKHNPDRWINAVSSCIEQGTCPRLRVFPALTPTAGCVSPAEVLRAVKSFKNGSSGGLDGLRPQHLRDVFAGPLPIDNTLNSLTQFINLILSGACPLSVRRCQSWCIRIEFLGTPLGEGDYQIKFFDQKLSELKFALGRVSCLSAHDALTIIRNALSLPKLMYFLRTSKHIDPFKLGEFDGALRTALSSICNVQEPSGISAHDGRRPNGCTLIPWRAGRCLAWDVTVLGTLAERYVNLTSKECGLAAARAADEKMKKYGNALPSIEFLPICIKVLGPMDPNTLKFLKAICKMISVRSGDSRELFFATNHISCLLQWFQRVCVLENIQLNADMCN